MIIFLNKTTHTTQNPSTTGSMASLAVYFSFASLLVFWNTQEKSALNKDNYDTKRENDSSVPRIKNQNSSPASSMTQ